MEQMIGVEGGPGIEPFSSAHDRSPDQRNSTVFTAARYVTLHMAVETRGNRAETARGENR
jgi:hypothetical protein